MQKNRKNSIKMNKITVIEKVKEQNWWSIKNLLFPLHCPQTKYHSNKITKATTANMAILGFRRTFKNFVIKTPKIMIRRSFNNTIVDSYQLWHLTEKMTITIFCSDSNTILQRTLNIWKTCTCTYLSKARI